MEVGHPKILVTTSCNKQRLFPVRLCQRPEFHHVLRYHQLYRARSQRANSRSMATYPCFVSHPGSSPLHLACKLIGRKWTGIAGFVRYIVLGFIIGRLCTLLTKSIPAFVVQYGLLQCIGHMGPGTTIGLVSAESCPTAVRGMEYGISGGFGKLELQPKSKCLPLSKLRLGNQALSTWSVGLVSSE
jgi:hypothetical protein